MPRKKILLLGTAQDKRSFLEGLEKIEGERNIYVVQSVEVQIMKTFEQFKPDHICPRTLDGYNAVIHLFNGHDDQNAHTLQNNIPDEVHVFIHMFNADINPADYLKSVLAELKDGKPYYYREPAGLSLLSMLFCWPGSSNQDTCRDSTHASNQSADISVSTWVRYGK